MYHDGCFIHIILAQHEGWNQVVVHCGQVKSIGVGHKDIGFVGVLCAVILEGTVHNRDFNGIQPFQGETLK